MITAYNPESEVAEFKELLERARISLNKDAQANTSYYINQAGRKLEQNIFDMMCDKAKGTCFEGTIDLVSGQKFPDIVSKKIFGVEVKSTTQNHCTTTGNSILESNRVDGVERLFLLFGKLKDPVEFRWRSYEECLADIRVTHSPRYIIDMNLSSGDTIFDKMGLRYDELRQRDNPISPVVDYFKLQLKEGESLWWVDSSASIPMKVRMWSSLNSDEKQFHKVRGMVEYPQIFGSSNSKFDQFSLELVTKFGIVAPSLRDMFSAGGKVTLTIQGEIFKNMPRIYQHVYYNSEEVFRYIESEGKSLEKWVSDVTAFVNDAVVTRFMRQLFDV